MPFPAECINPGFLGYLQGCPQSWVYVAAVQVSWIHGKTETSIHVSPNAHGTDTLVRFASSIYGAALARASVKYKSR